MCYGDKSHIHTRYDHTSLIAGMILCLIIVSHISQSFSAEISYGDHYLVSLLEQPSSDDDDALFYRAHYPQKTQFGHLSRDLLSQIDEKSAEADNTNPAQTPTDRGHAIASDFTSAAYFHLIPLALSDFNSREVILISRDDLATFHPLPEQASLLNERHLIWQFDGADYLNWPMLDPQPIAPLSYGFEVSALAHYAHAPSAPSPLKGLLSVSFTTFEGRLALDTPQDSIAVLFDIESWHHASVLSAPATLHHADDNYLAQIVLGHTDLPNASLFGLIDAFDTPENVPYHISFRNFDLPE